MSDFSTTQPSECSNMQEIRTQIDQIDRKIIALLGIRLGYVRAAARFKTSETTVRALDRVASMLSDRERWARDAGLEPQPIRQLFQNVIDHFTEHELREWSGHRELSPAVIDHDS